MERVGKVLLGHTWAKEWVWLFMGPSGLFEPMEEAVTATGSGPVGRLAARYKKGQFASLLSSSSHYFAAARRRTAAPPSSRAGEAKGREAGRRGAEAMATASGALSIHPVTLTLVSRGLLVRSFDVRPN